MCALTYANGFGFHQSISDRLTVHDAMHTFTNQLTTHSPAARVYPKHLRVR